MQEGYTGVLSDCAQIGRYMYALENGNENARKHYKAKFPNLKENTIRNFKRAYKQKLDLQRKQMIPQPVSEILHKQRGWPPVLLELDEQLIKFLCAVRNRGGVVNKHVVRATAKALIDSKTIAVSGASSVPIKGLTDKRCITLNFIVTLANDFLPMQIIYSGKTKASLPCGFRFPPGFCVTQNPKHWSNEEETIRK